MDEKLLRIRDWAKDDDEDDPDYVLKRMIEIEKEELNDRYTSRI